MAKIKEIFMTIVGFCVLIALGVFIYTTFIQDWGSTDNSYAPDDIGCTRAGDCY